MDKRDGGGSHNWGTFEDEIKAEDDKANISTEETPVSGSEKAANDGEKVITDENAVGSTDEPREEEPKTLTLDEWKAQQEKKEGPKFNVRKAGEGSDFDPKWKKTYAYKKEKETHEEEEEEVRKTLSY